MATVRRWYIYLVCFVALQALAWAAIGLLGNLAPGSLGGSPFEFAGQIAVLVISLPVYLVHWLWAQRLAGCDPDERSSLVRRLYLVANLATFLAFGAAAAYSLVALVLRLLDDPAARLDSFPIDSLARLVAQLVVLAVLYIYHQRLMVGDDRALPEVEVAPALGRLFLFSFSAVGLTTVVLNAMSLLRWVMGQFPAPARVVGDGLDLSGTFAGLIVGLPLWLIMWGVAQWRYVRSAAERESALRKFYLYAVVLVAVLTTVTNLTLILAGFFRGLLNLAPRGDLRDPLSVIVVMALLWAYHAYSVGRDAATAGLPIGQTAGVRRLYLYLVAAVGLGAFLIGQGAVISALLQRLGLTLFPPDLAEQLALSSALLIAGLPVWLLPWRRADSAAATPGPVGAAERRSVVRKIYLYFFIFAATMTVLSSAIYLVFRLLTEVLRVGGGGNLLADLGQALAYTVIGLGVWLYQGWAVRADGQRARRDQAERLAGLRVSVLDSGDLSFGRALLAGLKRELPELEPELIDLNAPPADPAAPDPLPGQLAAANLLVAGWSATAGLDAAGSRVALAVAASPARKLLVPMPLAGWEWAGVDRWSAPALVAQTVRAVRQWVDGDDIRAVRPMSAGSLLGLIVGVLVLLLIGTTAAYYFFM